MRASKRTYNRHFSQRKDFLSVNMRRFLRIWRPPLPPYPYFHGPTDKQGTAKREPNNFGVIQRIFEKGYSVQPEKNE